MILDAVNAVTNRGRNIFVDANRLAEGLFGSHMAVNMFLTGVAYPGRADSDLARRDRAGHRTERRRCREESGARSPGAANTTTMPPGLKRNRAQSRRTKLKPAFDRVAELTRVSERRPTRASTPIFWTRIQEPALREVVAKYLYKLMAYKDEYEVARLLTKPEFEQRVRDMWEAPEAISYNLHPPLLRQLRVNKKLTLGPWFRMPLMS